jgi:hypothetical protein
MKKVILVLTDEDEMRLATVRELRNKSQIIQMPPTDEDLCKELLTSGTLSEIADLQQRYG